MVAFGLFGGGGDLRMILLLENECRLGGGDNHRWWAHSNATCCLTNKLNFLHSQVLGMQKL